MSFLGNVSHAICNSTMSLLDRYPVISERFPGFCGLNASYVDEDQQTFLIGTLAASAIAAVGGLFGACLNRKGDFTTNALFLTTSALGAATFYLQYMFLGSLLSYLDPELSSGG